MVLRGRGRRHLNLRAGLRAGATLKNHHIRSVDPMSDLMRSAMPGVVWPAITDDRAAQALALQFQFEQSQWWPLERLQAQQLKQFQSVFRHAVATVPYYRDRYAAVTEISDWQDFSSLPVITRREVQLAGDAMHSEAPPSEHGSIISTQSSGSTASPLVTKGTVWTQLLWNAFLLRDHLWQRRDLRGKLAAIRSKTVDGAARDWGMATRAFVTGPSAVLGLTADIDEQVRWLESERPDYLLSLATNTRALAKRSLELGVRLQGLKQVRTFGETLQPDTRDIVRSAWGVAVVDSYSSEELGYIALQCPEHEHYHVQSEGLLVEVLNEDGSASVPGEVGRVVVSTLHNFAMPLLRYSSGDYAEVGDSCACGRGLPVLNRIAGRQRNMMVRPDGVRHWPSFPISAWAQAAPVLQLQLVQHEIDHIDAFVVLRRDFADDEPLRLIEALQGCLGYPFRITLKKVEEISRSAGGKYEDFVSLISQ